jgi:glucosamine-6-phosphate deaminase
MTDGGRPSGARGARVQIAPDTGSLARAAADAAADALRRAVEANGVANAMFATGNSQLGFVEKLVADTPGVPWKDVVVFHMDEYVGIGDNHPASFRRWIRERIVEPASPRESHYLDGLAPADLESARYADLLRRHPLDLCCLGIGENGHLAFNDPPTADFDDPLDVKEVVLERACREQQVHEGHFATEEEVPATAVTVTIPALLRATTVLAIVPEARKAAPVKGALEGPVSTSCPASILQRAPQTTIYLDPDSASLLTGA